jgi:MSHA biogenesis protein MshP
MRSIAFRQNGLMLPVAIFLLVILAGLVGYAMRLSLLANMGTTQDVQGARAYLAARAGAEWVAYKVLLPGSTAIQACPTSPTTLTINGFTTVLTCSAASPIPQDKGGTQNIGVYTIASTASYGVAGAQDYVQREIKVTLSRCLYGTEECN